MSDLRIDSQSIGAAADLRLRQAEGAETAKKPTVPTAIDGGPDFASVFETQVLEANRLQDVAAQKTEALARGQSDDLHGTMISVKEADISLKLVGAVRNKLLDAFHELWRINL